MWITESIKPKMNEHKRRGTVKLWLVVVGGRLKGKIQIFWGEKCNKVELSSVFLGGLPAERRERGEAGLVKKYQQEGAGWKCAIE